MKDAYSFDADAEGMARSYARMREDYRRIFTRFGLDFTPVTADAGAIGGAVSEEFTTMVSHPSRGHFLAAATPPGLRSAPSDV